MKEKGFYYCKLNYYPNTAQQPTAHIKSPFKILYTSFNERVNDDEDGILYVFQYEVHG